MTRSLVPAVCLLLTACLEPVPEAGGAAVDAGLDAGVELLGVGRASCAPNDGPAWSFMLSSQALTCAQGFGEGFSVDLWVGDLVPGSYALGTNGTACLCGVVGDLARSGTMVIEQVTTTEVVGHIDAVFQSGSEAHDRFRVVRCASVRQCG